MKCIRKIHPDLMHLLPDRLPLIPQHFLPLALICLVGPPQEQGQQACAADKAWQAFVSDQGTNEGKNHDNEPTPVCELADGDSLVDLWDLLDEFAESNVRRLDQRLLVEW